MRSWSLKKNSKKDLIFDRPRIGLNESGLSDHMRIL